jgi:hypothetical protein
VRKRDGAAVYRQPSIAASSSSSNSSRDREPTSEADRRGNTITGSLTVAPAAIAAGTEAGKQR